MSALRGMWATRDASDLVAHTEVEGEQLRRSMGPFGLTAMGVGAIIGTGIFVVIGEGAAEAGPAVILAFVLAAVTCLFSALSYAELASSVPVSGSAYTYSYATLGELVAFIIGWDLILEYGVSVAAVAVGWGGNLNAFLDSAFGYALPAEIAAPPEEGGVFNLPAVFIVVFITALLVRGTRESASVNMVMVVVKIAILIFFVIAALTSFSSANFDNFNPHGISGITSAAGLIFFAYIGFDAVSTGSEESNNPSRDLPVAIVGSLTISTILYVLVAVAAVGAAPIAVMTSGPNAEAPLSAVLEEGTGLSWASAVLSLGALVAITSVVLVIMYGQTRIFFAMCRDGLMPKRLAKIHPRYGTPARLTIAFGGLIALLAAFVPLTEIVELVNIGTLFAFVLVNIGVIVLRRTRPDMERPFRTPLVPLFPIIGILLCGYLMVDLPMTTWVRFVVWMAAGLVIYFAYSYSHSNLRSSRRRSHDVGGTIGGSSRPQGHRRLRGRRHRPRCARLRRTLEPQLRRRARRRHRAPRRGRGRGRTGGRRVGGLRA